MSTGYLPCTGWYDLDSCGTLVTPPTTVSPCNELILGDRGGYCLCHNGVLEIPRPCGHKSLTCSDICDRMTTGCHDPATQLQVFFKLSMIVGCDATWTEPGLLAAEQAACDIENGFHICKDNAYVQFLRLGTDACGNKAESNTFYLSNLSTDHRVFGCGNINDYDQLPVSLTRKHSLMKPFELSLSEEQMESGLYSDGSWKLKPNDPNGEPRDFRDRVYKTDISGGGVMCCRHKDRFKARNDTISGSSPPIRSIIYLDRSDILWFIPLVLFIAAFVYVFRTCYKSYKRAGHLEKLKQKWWYKMIKRILKTIKRMKFAMTTTKKERMKKVIDEATTYIPDRETLDDIELQAIINDENGSLSDEFEASDQEMTERKFIFVSNGALGLNRCATI